MSLINDALKKAQRQRGDESAPEPLPAERGPAPRRGSSSGGPNLMLGAGVGIVAACAIIVTVVVLMRQGEAPPAVTPVVAAPKSEPVPTVAGVADPGPASPRPATTQSASPESAPASQVSGPSPQVSNPSSQTQAPTVQTPDPRPQTPTPDSATGPINVPDLTLGGSTLPAAPAPATGIGGPSPEAGQNKAILTWLSTLRVAGIRPAGADSKVLMNDRVYKLNDVVDYSLGLKLTGIAIKQLTFVDEKGVSYVKSF